MIEIGEDSSLFVSLDLQLLLLLLLLLPLLLCLLLLYWSRDDDDDDDGGGDLVFILDLYSNKIVYSGEGFFDVSENIDAMVRYLVDLGANYNNIIMISIRKIR